MYSCKYSSMPHELVVVLDTALTDEVSSCVCVHVSILCETSSFTYLINRLGLFMYLCKYSSMHHKPVVVLHNALKDEISSCIHVSILVCRMNL